MRRTPLKRGDSVLKSNKPLRKRSKKTEEKYVERRKIVSQMLEANKECVACKVYHVYDTVVWSFPVGHPLSNVRARRTVDIHELVNRSQGGSILDGRNLLAVCRECHTRITTEPKEAERLGLHLESWCSTEEHYKEAERVRNEWQSGKPTKPNWLSD